MNGEHMNEKEVITTDQCLDHLDFGGKTCPGCDCEVNEFGNTENDFRYCQFPHCGCDGSRLCMASEGPSDRSIGGNIEGMWNGKNTEQRKARKTLIVDVMLEKK